MNKKTCDAFFCINQTPKKYRYCHDCAKRKGLAGGTNWFGWVVFFIIIIVLFG